MFMCLHLGEWCGVRQKLLNIILKINFVFHFCFTSYEQATEKQVIVTENSGVPVRLDFKLTPSDSIEGIF